MDLGAARLSGAMVLLVIASLGASSQAVSTPQTHGRRVHRTKTEVSKPVDPPKPVPIQPMSPEQLPAQAPRVSYRNGQLSIDAQNSTLNDVLAAVRRQTGAQIELPSGVAGERVVAHLSGLPSSVLSSLLDGSNLGYIIVGVPDSPGKIARVILSALPQGAQSAASPGVVGAASPGLGRSLTDTPDEEEPPDPGLPPDEPAPSQGEVNAPPGEMPAQLDQGNSSVGGEPMRIGQPAQVPPGPYTQIPNQPQVKTPDQLLQELQQMRQQQQQAQPSPQ